MLIFGDDLEQDAEAELERMRKQVQEMEDEARKLQEMQESIQGDSSNKEEVDQRSVFVGNVRNATREGSSKFFSLPTQPH
jgi:hypothetical protein